MKGAGALLIVVALLGASLAGCLGAPSGGNGSEVGPSGENPGGGGLGEPSTREPVDDGGQPIHEEATAWAREQWAGDRRIVIFDDAVQAGAALSTTEPTTCLLCGGSIEIPDDRSIYPGTDRIAVELDWNPPPTAPSMTVRFEWQPPGGSWSAETFDQPGNATITVGPDRTDVPFAERTSWDLDVDAYADPVGAHRNFEVDVTIEIMRDGPVPAIPVPPDPWNGTETIDLVDNGTRSNLLLAQGLVGGIRAGSGLAICSGSCRQTWPTADGAIVPADADRVRAVLTWDWSSPTKPMLHRAVDGESQPMEVVEESEDRRVFEIAVEPSMGDSPFQRRSDWSFYATLRTEGQDVGAVSGSMTLAATAQRNGTASSTY